MASDIVNNKEYFELMNEIKDKLRLTDETGNSENGLDETVDFKNFDYELITGNRGNSQLLWVPEENSLFKQNTFSKTFDGMAYTCYDNDCTARKVLNGQGQLITIAATHIPHLSMQPIFKKFHYLNLMKGMCRTEPHSVSVADIYNKVQAL